MKALGLTPLARLAGLAPLAVQVIVGAIMAAHGFQKLLAGPGNFWTALGQMRVPLPGLMGYVVPLVEVVGGVLPIMGLFSRLAAVLLTIELAVAILLVKTGVGFLSPIGSPGVGAELDLALIAGFLVILFARPGKLSLDYALGIEGDHLKSTSTRGDRARSTA